MKRFLVGGRVLKTTLAVIIAIYIAQQIGLEHVTLAAIVALLTVQKTFYHSLVESLAKLGSVLIGAGIGTAYSYIFGISPLGYGLVTLTAIYICLQLRWQDHIILTTATGVTVLFSGYDVPLAFSLEQILTVLLGAASALVVNYLFTPNHKMEVVQSLKKAEEGLRHAIDFIIKEMLEPGCDDSAFKEEIAMLKKEIETGLEIAKLFREEQRFIVNRETPSDRYRQIFHIFNSQLVRLEEMHKLAQRMPKKVPQAVPLIKLFRIVKYLQYRRMIGKSSHYRIVDSLMDNLEQSFASMELPQSREEFISRASLFHLFQEIRHYCRQTQMLPSAMMSKQGTWTKERKKQQSGKSATT